MMSYSKVHLLKSHTIHNLNYIYISDSVRRYIIQFLITASPYRDRLIKRLISRLVIGTQDIQICFFDVNPIAQNAQRAFI